MGLRALSSPKRHHVSGTPDRKEIIAKLGHPKEKPLKGSTNKKKTSNKTDTCKEREVDSKARSAKMLHISTKQGLRAQLRPGIVRLSLGPGTNFLFIPIIGPLSHPPSAVTAPS